MAKTTRSVDLEPIDRLEEKVKLLIAMVERLKMDAASAAADNQRLSSELEQLRSRLSSSEGMTSELGALRDERDIIRTRVTDMLQQLESISL